MARPLKKIAVDQNPGEQAPEITSPDSVLHDIDDSEEARMRRRALHKMISAELEDFLRYLSSPWHILWRNMLVGLTRGLGAIFGVTIVVGVAIWVLKIFIDLPLIGNYARDFRERVTEVAEQTRYSDDFVRLQSTMERIDRRLKEQNELLREFKEEQ